MSTNQTGLYTNAESYSSRPVAVVFGGPGGIGSVICRKLAEAGFCIVVGYNKSSEAASALAHSLPGGGHSARHAPVTNTQALAALAKAIANDYGRCDAIVNSAGTTRFVQHSDLDSLDDELIDNI